MECGAREKKLNKKIETMTLAEKVEARILGRKLRDVAKW
jgi:hypothetical protein